jgi:DNA polymerase
MKLSGAGEALGLPVQKDDTGHRVMLRLCKPIPKSDPPRYDEDPAKLQILYDYCKQDVDAEVELVNSIQGLSPSELKVWQLDQRINLRGLPIDVAAAEKALTLVQNSVDEATKELSLITGNAVTSPRQVAKLIEWLNATFELDIPDLKADTVRDWLQKDLPVEAKRVLEIRAETSQASTAKLQGMLDRVEPDGRVRGNLVYHGASTGRWAGRGIQIQNFPRGHLSREEVELFHELLPDYSSCLESFFGSNMGTVKSSLRSFIKAKEGNRLLVGDFASIEARVLAWVSGQNDLLDLFRHGSDVYKSMASTIYEVKLGEVTKQQRQIGKVAILGLGYGMGAKLFREVCRTMAGQEVTLKFAKRVVKTYRESNANIRSLWGACNNAAVECIQTGQPQKLWGLTFHRDKDYLMIKLPSGRDLFYRDPSLSEVKAPWSIGYAGEIFVPDEQALEALEELDVRMGTDLNNPFDTWVKSFVPKASAAEFKALDLEYKMEEAEPEYITQMTFKGTDSKTRKWKTQRTYGGKLVENIVQAIARDFLVEAMLRTEQAGYPTIATVHDEIMVEAPVDFGSLDEFESIMSLVPAWGRGCPIAVEGYESQRYRK